MDDGKTPGPCCDSGCRCKGGDQEDEVSELQRKFGTFLGLLTREERALEAALVLSNPMSSKDGSLTDLLLQGCQGTRNMSEGDLFRIIWEGNYPAYGKTLNELIKTVLDDLKANE